MPTCLQAGYSKVLAITEYYVACATKNQCMRMHALRMHAFGIGIGISNPRSNMSKYYFLLFLSAGLVAQDITGTQKIPTRALPGTDFIVETTINKGKINGFMKFFQEIPEGFTATEIESLYVIHPGRKELNLKANHSR